jgi:adenosine deaminase
MIALAGAAAAQSPSRIAPDNAVAAESRAARRLEAVRSNPTELYAFLYQMPKGADLHNHLGGAVYAESWIRAAGEDGLCVDTTALAFIKPLPQPTACAKPNVLAAQVPADQHLYDALIDAFSMRSFVPTPGVSGHDHFFSTFDKFGGTSDRHMGEWLDEVATRAAAQNEQYLELMDTPPFSHAIELSQKVPWNDDFAALRNAFLAAGLRDEVAVDRAHYDQAEALRAQREHCGAPQAAPACTVQIRYLYQILRGAPKERVFAQTLLGFETASADPRVVGINYVQPEDGYTSMRDYALHMRIVGFLHGLYPNVHISLHAGELAPGLVPYEGLCCHIRLAVEDAHAERIGHGVDIMYEDHPQELLREMAARHILVEINLTSNDVILGVSGKDHPFPEYRKFGVPVALSTDDEGVSRIDLTHEFVRAVQTYNLHYADLKQLARASLEHSFLPGASLWSLPQSPQNSASPEPFTHRTAVCAPDQTNAQLGAAKPSPQCAQFLRASEKAQAQWELERRFHAFETTIQ